MHPAIRRSTVVAGGPSEEVPRRRLRTSGDADRSGWRHRRFSPSARKTFRTETLPVDHAVAGAPCESARRAYCSAGLSRRDAPINEIRASHDNGVLDPLLLPVPRCGRRRRSCRAPCSYARRTCSSPLDLGERQHLIAAQRPETVINSKHHATDVRVHAEHDALPRSASGMSGKRRGRDCLRRDRCARGPCEPMSKATQRFSPTRRDNASIAAAAGPIRENHFDQGGFPASSAVASSRPPHRSFVSLPRERARARAEPLPQPRPRTSLSGRQRPSASADTPHGIEKHHLRQAAWHPFFGRHDHPRPLASRAERSTAFDITTTEPVMIVKT